MHHPGLGYSLADTAGLGVVDRISNMVFLTRPPGDAPTTLNDPLFVIGSVTRLGGRGPSLAEFAEQRVTRIAEIKNVELVSGEEFSLDGLRAYQTFASAEDIETSTPIRVYQVLVFYCLHFLHRQRKTHVPCKLRTHRIFYFVF